MIPEVFIAGIPSLCIDASSVIYQLRIGLLGSLAAEIELISTPEIIKEVGWPELPIRSIQIDAFQSDKEQISNDDALLLLAKKQELPLMSEDKGLLLKAAKQNRPYYNSLMMLNYLFLKNRITSHEYPEYLKRLKDYARYSPEVLEYGHLLYQEICHMKKQQESG